MSEIHVQIDQLSLSIEGVPLLDIPFLRLDPQGPTMILGPNGAGKSLFLRVLHALQTPDTGSVQVRHISGETARQAMVFQRPVLLRRSVRANLRFALSAAGYARQTRCELAEKWMHQGQLAHLADQPARRLSGGEQQRLSLVRALCCNPEILFLDEPCAHLDVNAAQHVEALINSAIEAGIKVVMITHDRAQALVLPAIGIATPHWFHDRARWKTLCHPESPHDLAPASAFGAAPPRPLGGEKTTAEIDLSYSAATSA